MAFHIMGTGSRSFVTHPHRLEMYNHLVDHMKALYQQHDDVVFVSGMAEGWDEAIAKAALRNNMPYIAVVPFPSYGIHYWSHHRSFLKTDRIDVFNQLLVGAEYVRYTASDHDIRSAANFYRNQVMVDMSNHALVFNPTSSGTKDAVVRLDKANVPYEVYPFNK